MILLDLRVHRAGVNRAVRWVRRDLSANTYPLVGLNSWLVGDHDLTSNRVVVPRSGSESAHLLSRVRKAMISDRLGTGAADDASCKDGVLL
jgi:hypothetical protein